jgi:hypothetical protein
MLLEGIISGLAVIGIVWLGKLIWQFIISPTIQRLTYHATKIEGQWITNLGEQQKGPYREKVTMKRNGTSVKGTIECIECGPTDEDLSKKYDFLGSFKNGFLNCTYSIGDKSRIDLGCFCLRITTDGNSFKGYCISYHHPSEALKPLEYAWQKQDGK